MYALCFFVFFVILDFETDVSMKLLVSYDENITIDVDNYFNFE